MSARTLRPAHVRVPCSTSNLGAGFDCLGLALSRHIEADFTPGAALGLERSGTLATLSIAMGDDFVVRAFQDRLRERGHSSPGGRIRVHSEIPVARGLGSSAAALVAGCALADAAAGERFEGDTAFAYATLTETHPDNAAPCAFGGLMAAVPSARADTVVPVRLPLSAAIAFAFAAPPVTISTDEARAALPRTLPFDVAVDAVRRMTALVQGLATASPALLAAGFEDRVHVPLRLARIPGGRPAIDAAGGAGAWAVTVSGSGSGLIAACPRGTEDGVATAMRRAFAEHCGGEGVVAFAVSPDLEGAQILDS